MRNRKPKLSLDEQIEHLKSKGIGFNIMDESKAKEYLEVNNNYFKLTSYRKNYGKHPDGENKGKYINLEFAYLVDMAVIDMQLRYAIVQIALDIEHHTKLQLLRKIDEYDEDGYQIVEDYIGSLDEKRKVALTSELSRNENSIYCGSIIKKYNNGYPIWAFIEVVSFGRLISFYKYCADRFGDREMDDNYYRLLTCKEIRNASAHSNCILNDLNSETSRHNTNKQVTNELTKIKAIPRNFRRKRMSNARVQQIITLLYIHITMVESKGIMKSESANLKKFMDRIDENCKYYDKNELIKGTFDFIGLVIDNWYQIV